MQEGKASFTLSGDYYNRELSGKYGSRPTIWHSSLVILKQFCIIHFLLRICKSIRPTVQITLIFGLESFYR